MPEEPLTYRSAGVDIEEAGFALRSVSNLIKTTHGERVLGGMGGFGGLFSAAFPEMEHPVLVSSIDGVGTKTKVAAMAGDYSGLGVDIVHHCVNDILCQGARPLFFLDYFGCSRLHAPVLEAVIAGAADACRDLGCALIGGETAEMPGVYVEDEVDVVGAIVGLVDYSSRLPREKPEPGDKVIGIASNGLHTNGYSLARKALFDFAGLSVRDPLPGSDETLGEALLRPHRCYFNSVYPLLQESDAVVAVAHITGGGLYDNLPRVVPSDMQIVIERRSWTPLPIFLLIQSVGSIEDAEMYRAFNMGIGMVLIVRQFAAAEVLRRLEEMGEHAAEIGEVQKGSHDVQIV